MPAPIIVRRNVLHRGAAAAAAGARSFITAPTPEQYLTTTWGHAPTDPTRLTISFWYKINTALANSPFFFTAASSGPSIFSAFYNTSTFKHNVRDGATFDVFGYIFNPDTDIWHHACYQLDSNLASPSSFKYWLDGTLISNDPGTYPALGTNFQASPNGVAGYIGQIVYLIGNTLPCNIKYAYFHFLDGQALDYTNFTTGSAGVGNLHPAAYAGAYGANGFLLNGAGGTLADQGPNGIVWTAPNGITFSTDLPPP